MWRRAVVICIAEFLQKYHQQRFRVSEVVALLDQSGSEPDHVKLTIREDGSYDVVSRQTYGTSRGRGRIGIGEGRLILEGEKGRGVATLSRNSSGDRVMNIEATLSDNRLLTVKLSPTR
jgi:hypothetical protein